jgi:hypothetical protein
MRYLHDCRSRREEALIASERVSEFGNRRSSSSFAFVLVLERNRHPEDEDEDEQQREHGRQFPNRLQVASRQLLPRARMDRMSLLLRHA